LKGAPWHDSGPADASAVVRAPCFGFWCGDKLRALWFFTEELFVQLVHRGDRGGAALCFVAQSNSVNTTAVITGAGVVDTGAALAFAARMT